jgi:hypothetical protein
MLQSRRQCPRYRLLHLSLEVLEVSIRPVHHHAHFRLRLPLGHQPNPARQRRVSRDPTLPGEGRRTRLVRRNQKQEVFWQWRPHKTPPPRPRQRQCCRPLPELLDSR